MAYDHSDYNHITHWLCECDCGEQKVVSRTNLMSGSTISCGCYNREAAGQRAYVHGCSNTHLYEIWHGMRQRCSNTNKMYYDRYGGRGIYVCDNWNDFECFRDWAVTNGYEPGLTIDRINNNDGYYPENCRWVDWYTQHNNKSNNRRITYNGACDTMANWARKLGVNYGTLKYRVNAGNMRDFEEYFETDR